MDAEMDEVELPCDAEREPVVVLDAGGTEWVETRSVWPVCVN